ncbi:MAG: hypothetical protein ABIQ04_00220 [Candidatus Saccharimonadales bacterium]
MPLIDVTLKPGSELVLVSWGKTCSQPVINRFIRTIFGPSLPPLFVANSEALGMEDGTPEDAIQVQFHDFGKDDINVANFWVKVQFSETAPEESSREKIVNSIYSLIHGVFHGEGFEMFSSFVLDVLWGPTSGCGYVNGTIFKW